MHTCRALKENLRYSKLALKDPSGLIQTCRALKENLRYSKLAFKDPHTDVQGFEREFKVQ